MTQWLIIIALAYLPSYLNKRYVIKQLREEAIQMRVQWRREAYRRILNAIHEMEKEDE